MSTLGPLVEVRQDGQRITEAMQLADICALGPPSPVVALCWTHGARPVVLDFAGGALARVVEGRAFVAVLGAARAGDPDTLSVLRADGSCHATIADTAPLAGRPGVGRFRWFEPARAPAPHVFGVVFERAGDHALFHLDIDAAGGAIVGSHPTR